MDDAAQAYFQQVESHFITRRGRPLLLSPEDVSRVAAWHAAGIPLGAVVEGIDLHFDRLIRRGRTPRRAVTLAYVEDDVHDAWAGAKRRRLGRSRPAEVAEPLASKGEHERLVASLREAGERCVRAHEPVATAVASAIEASCEKLSRKADLFVPESADHDEQRAEDHLRRLEKSLLLAIREAAVEEMPAIERSVDADLADKRARMGAATFERVRAQLIDQRLRERFGLPRLSLFYT